MNIIIRAFQYASEMHANQVRKASIVPGVPYMSHLMEVAGMVQASGGDEKTVAAALLHDALEDTQATIHDLASRFPVDVVQFVLECTEKGTEGGQFKAPWKGRKQAYLDHLAHVSPQALLISVADKLQSLREVRRQVRIQGDEAYAAFAKKEYATIPERKEAVLWFHVGLAHAFVKRLLDFEETHAGTQALISDFNEIVEMLVPHDMISSLPRREILRQTMDELFKFARDGAEQYEISTGNKPDMETLRTIIQQSTGYDPSAE